MTAMVNHPSPLTICSTNRVYCLYLLCCDSFIWRGEGFVGSRYHIPFIGDSMLQGAGQDGWFKQQYLRRCIFSVMRCSTALHLGGGTKMHQTDAVSIKVSDGQLKDEHRISATISSCLMGPGADQHRLCTNRWCFGRKLQSCLLHSEKTQGDKIDLTLEDMEVTVVVCEQ